MRRTVRSSLITLRRRVPLSFPLGSSEARPQALQAPLYARHRLPRPLLCSKPSSRLSNRSTNSNCSFSFVSTLMARRRTFKTCEATAATALSWRPSSTSSARSESLCLISESSACGRPRPARLPPRAAARLRASALAGSCHQQKVCGGSTLTVHGELSRLVPRQRFISLGPLPLLTFIDEVDVNLGGSLALRTDLRKMCLRVVPAEHYVALILGHQAALRTPA